MLALLGVKVLTEKYYRTKRKSFNIDIYILIIYGLALCFTFLIPKSSVG